MTDTDRLAALLHDDFTLSGFWSCVHSTENEWAPWCDVLARRLITAGVTLAATPAPLDEKSPQCECERRCPVHGDGTITFATPAPLDVIAAVRTEQAQQPQTILFGPRGEPLLVRQPRPIGFRKP